MRTRIPIMQTSIREDYPHNLLMDLITENIKYDRTDNFFNFDAMNLTEDQQAGLEYAISCLTEPLRQVLDLIYRQNYSITQAATALGKCSSTITKHRSHALAMLGRPQLMRYIRYGKEAWSQKLAAEERIKQEVAEEKEIQERERIRLGTCAVIPLEALKPAVSIPYNLKWKGYRTIGDLMNEKPEDFYKKSGLDKREAAPIILAVRDVCRKYADDETVWDNGTCPICKFTMPAGAAPEMYNFCPHCGTRLNPEYVTGTK